ncbi:MAG: hypothetical protein ACREOU_06085 [Candidatus Eiseniibacteriota bacterium]
MIPANVKPGLLRPAFPAFANAFALALAAAAIVCSPAGAQVHLSLFHPVSTNPDPNASANFALSVFHSRIGSLNGLGLHPIVSTVGGQATGVQIVGAYSRVGGAFKGVMLTGAIASVGDDVRGLQTAGIGNFVEGGFGGIQTAGVLNAVAGDFGGLQFASVVNMNSANTQGIQISAVANVVEGGMNGLQAAGGMNLTEGAANGLQVAVGNIAGESRGAQIGLFNFGSRVHGLQLGAVNVAGSHSGIPIGLVNFSRQNGRVELVAFGSTLSAANVGVRTTVNRFQSTLSAGGIDLQGDVETAAFLTWNYGYRFPLGGAWSLGADVGFTHIMPEKTDDPTDHDRLHFALLGRLLPEVQVSPAVAIFAGPGFATIFDEYSQHAGSETEFLATAGLAVRP